MKKLKKLDLSGVKDFLFQKGERVGLVVCGGIALLLVGSGLKMALASRENYVEKYKREALNLEKLAKTEGRTHEGENQSLAIPDFAWKFVPVKEYGATQLFPVNEVDDNKRRNPTIFKVEDDARHIQVKFLRGGYFSYELENDKVVKFKEGKGGAGNTAQAGAGLVTTMKPVRMVVVTGVFPWKKQMEEYQRALRYETMPDLVAKTEDLPHPLGLNVLRSELEPDGEWGKWVPIYQYDSETDTVQIAERIKQLFREALIDDHNPLTLGDHLQHGLVTPLPLLANIAYPKLDLPGIKVKEDIEKKPRQFGGARGAGPGMKAKPWQQPGGNRNAPNPAANAPIADYDRVPLNSPTLPPELQHKFAGKIDFFDYDASIIPEKEDAANAVNLPPSRWYQRKQGGPGKSPVGIGGKIEIVDAVVRFIDVDVKPGKTYSYVFQVRMANPNFDKKDKVAFQALAEPKELVSNYTKIPQSITIPDEFYYYAVDQQPQETITEGSDVKAAKADSSVAYGNWTTTVQIHKWLDKFTDGIEWPVADWAIAERLLVRRGDTIGRLSVMTEVKVWDKELGDFKIGFQAQMVKKNQKRAGTGLPIHFIQDTPPPLLVDFEGGVRKSAKDESAVELLILTTDNKLTVRNSRHDDDRDSEIGKDRYAHWDTWLKEIQGLKKANQAANNPFPRK